MTKEATNKVAGKVEWTGAKDENGVPVPLSIYDYERLSRPEIDAYEERREQQIADKRKEANEADDLALYTERFVEAGGERSDAQAAFKAHRQQQAAEEASR